VRNKTNGGPNNLLKELIAKVEIHAFIEKIPTINEIFISKVKGGNHE
jgi:ABC-2 type transport system ATP-binding protein